MNRAIFAVSLFLLAGSMPSAWADAPGLLTYQGRVQENGAPVTGNRSVDIQLCDSSSGGNCYSNGAQSVSVQNGLFRSTFTAPSGANLNTGVWYVQIVVNGANLSPREQFTSSPYALVASSAATLAVSPTSPGATVSTNVFVFGNMGVGTNAPQQKLDVVGNISQSGVFISSGIGNSYFAGRIGIGTMAPSAKVDVYGAQIRAVDSGSDAIRATAGTGVEIEYSGMVNKGYVRSYNRTGSDWTYLSLQGSTVTINDESGGNVGIGTSVPTQKLDVAGIVNALGFTVNGVSISSGSGGTSQWATSGSSVYYNGGNVGIATANPSAKFDVYGGQIRAVDSGSVAIRATSGTGVEIEYDGGANKGYVRSYNRTTSTSAYLSLQGTPVTINDESGGNVGIGTNAPQQRLDVTGSISESGVFISSGTGSDYFAGSVGIGSANPTQKLDVAGIVNAQGFTINGVSISSSGGGSSPWTTLGTNIYYSSGNVGIGTSTPDNALQVANLINFDNTYSGTFLGAQAGHSHAQETAETLIGYQAGYGLGNMGTNLGLGGSGNVGANTAIGYQALYSDTDNAGNTAIGYKALYANNSTTWPQATENTAVGTYALLYNGIGTMNSALEGSALFSNTSGNSNVAIGEGAMNNNTTGSNNTALGANAISNGNNSNSVAIGMNAGSGVANNSFSDNAIVGYSSGFGLTTGSNDTLLGYESGFSLTSGSGNIEIGNFADAIPATGSNMLDIGNLIFGININGQGTNLSTGNIGIGTSNPTQKLDVAGVVNAQGFMINGVSISSASSGGSSQWTTSGTSIYYTTGNVGIGTAVPGGLFQIAGGTLTVLSNGYVGIGTLTPQEQLDVYSPVSGAYSARFSSLGKNNIDLVANNGTSEMPNGINFDSYVPAQSGVRSVGLLQMVSGGHMAFYTSQDGAIVGTERMRLTATGSLGIGTTTPSQLLDVSGIVNAQGFTINGVSITSGSTGSSQWTTTGTSIYYSSGNVGIGTSIPDNMLQVSNLVNFDNTYQGTFLGYQAGRVHAQDTAETLIGYQAGYNLANMGSGNGLGGSGDIGANTALGYQALYSDTDNAGNTAIGYKALYANNSTTAGLATSNTAVGLNAMLSNSSGSNNSALGAEALSSNTSGNQNIAIGPAAMNSNTTGSNNIAIGFGTMNNGVADSNNTVVGIYAGSGAANNAYSDDSILGYYSGFSLSTGSNNSLLGYQAGYSLTTGSGNIEIGNDADAIPAASSNMLNIGNLIFATGMNGTGSTLSTGNVGLGTKAPQQKFDVAGNISESGVFISSGTGNSFFAGSIGIGTSAPSAKVDVYGAQIRAVNSGSDAIRATTGTGVELEYDGTANKGYVRSYNRTGGAFMYLSLQGSTVTINDESGGNVGIGTSAPTQKLDVAGIVNAQGFYVNGSPLSSGGTSQWTTSGTSVYYNGGNVGIATANPSAKLDVFGAQIRAVNSGADALRATTGTGVEIEYDGVANKGVVRSYNRTTSTSTYLSLQGLPVTINDESGGNVGIGTASPASKFHVSGGDIQVGDPGAPKGITLYDQSHSASAYCLTVNNGSLAVTAGACQ